MKGLTLLQSEKYNTLLFDLDDTLYESASGVWQAIRDRIGLYMHERLALEWDVIPKLRANLFSTYGTTLRGLIILYDIDPQDYLDFVHNIPMRDYLKPDESLRRILESYPQRKIIFTNADRGHANRVLDALDVKSHFERIIDIRDIEPHCKPMVEAFHYACGMADIDPSKAIMLDDSQPNLAAARSLGMGTIRVGSKQLSWDYDECIANIHELPEVLGAKGHDLTKEL